MSEDMIIEAVKPQSAVTEKAESEAVKPQSAVTEKAEPEAVKPQSAVTEKAETEAVKPQSAVTEKAESKAVKPKTESAAGAETTATDAAAAPAKKPKKKEKKKKKKLPPKVITLENVGMCFHLTDQKVDNLKEYFIRIIKRKLNYHEFWALKDVTFHVRKGWRVGILGLNGAGKSTLLKCIAGVLKPTEGSVSTTGNIVPLLELGAGFDRNYTGAENIYLYGTMLGYSRAFLKEKFNDIVEFSELGEFINTPVKNYSSGMKARLGFSIATIVDPEILILDEVLSVGDARFRRKSEMKLRSMMKSGVTVLFVSHSTEQVLKICNRAVILDRGRLIANGKAVDICAQYEEMISKGAT